MGTRAEVDIKPLGLYVITQFDGDNIKKNLTKSLQTKEGRKNILKTLDKHHQIRAKATTRKGVRQIYGVTKADDYYLFIEYRWIVTKNWKVKEDKKYKKDRKKWSVKRYGY